ncbi:hypothetical protein [Allopontixanthobacter sediminis]|uniref:Uncharacterized protein n=1 Tax=Allopontixanthobacter sediminis TaxID=1689985 RepID=A0A845ATX0_9SPHN|nr:hypothetical protein [Allopontixanthobacter sediminis]MXP43003.1 hypothetical protein [Allopontixanthobacter sediminis]
MIALYAAKALGFLKGIPWQVWAGIAALLIVGLAYCQGVDAGETKERAKWEKQVAEIRAERDAAMARATKTDTKINEEGTAAIEGRRKELDDAKANLPDQGLTDRQRARACAELQRQGRGCEVFTPGAR